VPSDLLSTTGHCISQHQSRQKSVSLNLKTPRGKEILKDLVRHCDILVENYRPGTMEKLGLGFEVLKEINPA
jgi:crotonobetainyl-CoA:carnitine CoA-transferase CaiB-like acyl-CoA transferase